MPVYRTLITVPELRSLVDSGAAPVLLDCSFDLVDPAAGTQAYARGHLPGAVHADLEGDLSGAKTGRNGRHPLPDRAALAATVGGWGVAPGVQVVAYDAQGAACAARAWWLLRWLGHEEVAVLDGGLAAWVAAWAGAGSALERSVPPARPQPPYPAGAPAMPTIDAAALLAALGRVPLLDARSPERFRGEVETIDPVAGHIPGARLRFFKDNLQPDGRFKPAAALRAEFEALGGTAGDWVHACGSGVTACHNLLAMAHGGLDSGRLYPGSWSEWCADPARPIARG